MEFTLEKLEVYQLAESFGDEIWEIVVRWPGFPRYTIGRQLVEAADSISSNIAEGYGRYFFKESKQFFYYARGSLLESKSWLKKSKSRGLITESVSLNLLNKLDIILKKLNGYIKFISLSPKHNPPGK